MCCLVSYLCEDYNGIIIKSIGEFACDELGEFVGEGTRKLFFNSDSKPAENYKEISYAEIEKIILLNYLVLKQKN